MGSVLQLRKKSIQRLATVVLGLAVGAAVAVPGWFYWQRQRPIYLQEPGHQRSGHRYLYDPLLGWRNIPGWEATTNGKKLTINSRGLRDREYALIKPRGVTRVLVLGDSYTWGYGVADDEIYTEVLERSLGQRGAAVQVINSGVSGWGTDQEYLFLQSEGLQYQPDVVVLALFLINDPENNSSSVQYGLSKPVFTDLKLTRANLPVPKPGVQAPRITSRNEALGLTVAIIEAMAALCQKNNSRLVVMKFGCFPGPVPAGIHSWENRLERLMGELRKVAYLDLDRALASGGIPNERLIRGNQEGHWNALGHQEVARHLGAFLEEWGLVEVGNKE